ncbi:MAG TPA: hypothetical protein VGJ05_13970 [Fimbriiglobus sp.]
MADKYTPLIVAALNKAAATHSGNGLYGSKTAPGLFPNTVAGKAAAARAVSEGFLSVARAEPKGKEAYSATDKGLRFLLEQSNPKAVLEDLVRGLEARQGQVDELLTAAQTMTAELTTLKATVAAVLPGVVQTRVGIPPPPMTVLMPGERSEPGSENAADYGRVLPFAPAFSRSRDSGHGVAMVRTPTRKTTDSLAATILARLADWSSTAGAGQDCPLPDLYRSLTVCDDLTVGRFHDGLRSLHAEKKVYLHPWTGPLYAMPEPAFALLVGHDVSYYASLGGS